MPKRQRKEAEFSAELLDTLISGHESPEDFFGTDGLLKRLQAAVTEREDVPVTVEISEAGIVGFDFRQRAF